MRPPPVVRAELVKTGAELRRAREKLGRLSRDLQFAISVHKSRSEIEQHETRWIEAKAHVDRLKRGQRALAVELAGDWAAPAWRPGDRGAA